MKNINANGFALLRNYYLKELKKAFPELRSYLYISCHLSKICGKMEFSFEPRSKEGAPREKLRVMEGLSPRLKLSEGEKQIYSEYGIKVRARTTNIYGGTTLYFKACVIPLSFFPRPIGSQMQGFRLRERCFEKAENLLIKIVSGFEKDFVPRPKVLDQLLEIRKIYLNARSDSYWRDRSSFNRTISKFFGIRDLNIDI